MATTGAVANTDEGWGKLTEVLPPDTKIADLAEIGKSEGPEDSRPVIDRQEAPSEEKK